MVTLKNTELQSPGDYASDQEVRWCPGCGDYAILKTVQRYCASENLSVDDTVFVSGIGCAARFPYYMNTYGFHTIHGRAPTFATGLKMINPDLDVWLVTGDGDSMAIGGNHMMHLIVRDVDLQVLLFNNRIYGLTKGQISPTSPIGLKTPSTPKGSRVRDINPLSFAIGVGASFVARSVDVWNDNLTRVIGEGHKHRGASFIEIWQNCVIYNDRTFADVTDKQNAKERQLLVEDGEPLLFGEGHSKGLVLDRDLFQLEVVDLEQHPSRRDEVIVFNRKDRHLAMMLAEMQYPDFPTAFGVLYQKEHHDLVVSDRQVIDREEKGKRLQKKMFGAGAWKV